MTIYFAARVSHYKSQVKHFNSVLNHIGDKLHSPASTSLCEQTYNKETLTSKGIFYLFIFWLGCSQNKYTQCH